MKLLPDPKVFQWVWCAALLVFWLLAALGCCKKNRVEAEVGIAGFPNGGGSGGTGGTNPLTRFRVPDDEMALPQGGEMRRLPHALLGKRLGRDMRHAELYTLTHKPRFPWVFLPCWDPPEDRITIRQVPWSVRRSCPSWTRVLLRPCWRRTSCTSRPSMRASAGSAAAPRTPPAARPTTTTRCSATRHARAD